MLHDQFLHIRMPRALDRINVWPPEHRAALLQQSNLRVDIYLLTLGKALPPLLELVGIFDHPFHVGTIISGECPRQVALRACLEDSCFDHGPGGPYPRTRLERTGGLLQPFVHRQQFEAGDPSARPRGTSRRADRCEGSTRCTWRHSSRGARRAPSVTGYALPRALSGARRREAILALLWTAWIRFGAFSRRAPTSDSRTSSVR